MTFDLEKFYENEISLFTKLNCRYQQLLEVRSGVRDEIKRLKRKRGMAMRDKGYDYKDYNNQVVTKNSSEIGKAKIQRKRLGRQLKKIQKLIGTREEIFNEVFPSRAG